jgi:hypothetical protein
MRSDLPLLAATLAAAVAVFACSESDTPATPGMEQSPPETAAVASNCIGVPTTQPAMPVSYNQKRVYLESQGWWGPRRVDGTVPSYGNSEHIHVGMCFPLKQTVSGSLTFHVRVQGHKLKQGFRITTTGLHDPDVGQGNGIALASINWNYLFSATGGFDEWRTVTVDTRNLPNGRREFRNLTKVIRDNGEEIHASSGWCWVVDNPETEVTAHSGNCENTPNSTSGRGWYSCFEYKIAEVKNWMVGSATPLTDYPWSGINAGSNFSFRIAARDGAGMGDHNTLTRWEVRLDPDFHNLDNGDLIASGTGITNGTSVTINGSQYLSNPRTYRVVILGLSNDNCDATAKGQMAAVLSFPLKVN